jgi:uncharacterized protein (TIGR02147 family)
VPTSSGVVPGSRDPAGKPVIYQYMNYRQFLRDAYDARKATAGKYSYRYYAQKAGLRSPSHVKMVLDGTRNLTATTARSLARAFGLDAQATRFFLALVAMNQAKTTEERAQHYEELSRMPAYRASRQLERAQYQYYARWYCVPIRELVARGDFREDPRWIAGQLRPGITPVEAREALDLLLALGLLVREESGRLRQADPLIATGPELRTLSMRAFHREMLHLAASALDSVPIEERSVRGVTLRLTAAQVKLLQRLLFEMAEQVLQHDGVGEGPEAVYHFGVQLFPLTYPSRDGGTP